MQGYLHCMVERDITRNNFGKWLALAVIVFDYENFCAHTKANAEAGKSVSERTVVWSQEQRCSGSRGQVFRLHMLYA